MSLETDVDTLARVPLFAELTGDQLRLLAFGSERTSLGRGDTLFRRGDQASSGFVVTDGSIELIGIGEPAPTETCGVGCLIGELPLFVETKRKVTAVATERSTAVVLTRQLMRRMLDEYPSVAAQFHAKVAGRLMGTIGELRRVQGMLERGDR